MAARQKEGPLGGVERHSGETAATDRRMPILSIDEKRVAGDRPSR